MKNWDIVKNRNRAKDIEVSQNLWTARSGSGSMVGLTAEGIYQINVTAKAMQLSSLSLCRGLSHVEQVTNLLICTVAHSSPPENIRR